MSRNIIFGFVSFIKEEDEEEMILLECFTERSSLYHWIIIGPN
jgi:hypothetical protein